jgi:magnesium chelatase family protein
VFCRLASATILGVDASIVEVEVDLKRGLPCFSVVGLPDPAVRESRERVAAAMGNSGFELPLGRLTVNLAPANLRKAGSNFDLAIALGIIGVSRGREYHDRESFIILGELSLDGAVRPVRGILAILQVMGRQGYRNVILPCTSMAEASLLPGGRLFPVSSLKEAVEVLCDTHRQPFVPTSQTVPGTGPAATGDFIDVKGQGHAVRAVEVAAAGGHNVLMIGPPGSGKTMIASRLPSILPEMTDQEALETTNIQSVAGVLDPGQGILRVRPFRAPHHTASDAAIVGGGRGLPGEITLAHNGVLFLDELAEFRNNIIQALRQPLEAGRVTISRAEFKLVFPADFMLVAAMNPCPCGFLFDQTRRCRCSVYHINRYFTKVSGPIFDRIDIQVQMTPTMPEDLFSEGASDSNSMKKRIDLARRVQAQRYTQEGVKSNAELNGSLVSRYCALSSRVRCMLSDAASRYRLSGRSFQSVLKVARTIADLEGKQYIEQNHLLEALSYREVERVLFNQ